MKTQAVLCALFALVLALADARFGEAKESLAPEGDADSFSLDTRNVQDTEEEEDDALMKRATSALQRRGIDYQYGCGARTLKTKYTCHPQLPGIRGTKCCLTTKDTVVTLTKCDNLQKFGCLKIEAIKGKTITGRKVGRCHNIYNGRVILKAKCPNGKTYNVRVRKFVTCVCKAF